MIWAEETMRLWQLVLSNTRSVLSRKREKGANDEKDCLWKEVETPGHLARAHLIPHSQLAGKQTQLLGTLGGLRQGTLNQSRSLVDHLQESRAPLKNSTRSGFKASLLVKQAAGNIIG